jgi:hypothetical protein
MRNDKIREKRNVVNFRNTKDDPALVLRIHVPLPDEVLEFPTTFRKPSDNLPTTFRRSVRWTHPFYHPTLLSFVTPFLNLPVISRLSPPHIVFDTTYVR